MSNAILKSFWAVNFGPFADKVEFTTQATKEAISELRNSGSYNTVISNGEEYFNKVSYIYGANSAGKSFCCKILDCIQDMIRFSPVLAAGNEYTNHSIPFSIRGSQSSPFLFDSKYADVPTEFGIELIIDNIHYSYEYSLFKGNVKYEKLYKKVKRRELILERNESDISLKAGLMSFRPFVSLGVVKENVLCLSMAAIVNNKLATNIVEAINGMRLVFDLKNCASSMDINEAYSKDRIQEYLKIIQKADPTVVDLSVKIKEGKDHTQEFGNGSGQVVTKKAVLDIRSTHRVIDNNEENYIYDIPFSKLESRGTVKLFGMLPILFEVLEHGFVLVMDEIDSGLHPSLAKTLIDIFNSEKLNPYNAQLICTAHNTSIIEENVRRDQVWIVEKDVNGKSSIFRLSKLAKSRRKRAMGSYIEEVFSKLPNFIDGVEFNQ